ncbi:MAG TPA: biopolymer transporter ExbD, partial [Gemmataceae bacterium]|nr:biopolymer transporter ExbD [Gemmataceae bacterium]
MSTSTLTGTSWKVRHQGSPRSIDGLRLAQVVEGLQDGLWEPTDEVMAPQERQWVSIESHPQLVEIVAELEPPLVKEREDETRLDMNPLIDVALVLLIFFILTTSYAMLQKVLEMPATKEGKPPGQIVKVKQADVRKFTIKVTARQENGKPVIMVEDEEVDQKNLVGALRQYVKDTQKTEMLLDAKGVNWGTIVAIQDAAKG